MRRIGHLAVIVLALATTLLPQKPMSVPGLADMKRREIELLELYGGGSRLSASEKKEAEDLVEGWLRTMPQEWMQINESSRQLIQKLASNGPAFKGEIREGGRMNSEIGKASDPAMQDSLDRERLIIRAHDPTVYFDGERHFLITEQTLRELRTASQWAAKMFQLDEPGSDFIEIVREAARTNGQSFEPEAMEGMTHIERNYPYAAQFFSQIGKQKAAEFFAANRAALANVKDHRTYVLTLAKTTAVISKNAAAHAARGPGGATTGLGNRQMQQNEWLIRHPECAPGGSHPSSCNEAPIQP